MWKQHYLSQFYLKWFSSDENKRYIFCYDRELRRFIQKYNSSNEQMVDMPEVIEPWKIENLWHKGNNLWNIEIKTQLSSDFENNLWIEMCNFRKTDDITKLSHRNLMKFIMMQLVRSQVAWDEYLSISNEEIKKIKLYFWETISSSEFRNKMLDSFIARIHDESDIEWLWSFRNRKIYLSKTTWEKGFITTNFPFIHDHHGDIYFPLTSQWVVFITWEMDPIITRV
jgi:hypothetical protein